MKAIRNRGEQARRFILENVAQHPSDIAKITSEKFECSRQAVHRHLSNLQKEGALLVSGSSTHKIYALAPLTQWMKVYAVDSVDEGRVWIQDIAPGLGPMPENVLDIWHYGFTEMFNNALDHAAASFISVDFRKTAVSTRVQIADDGVGIFKKIQAALNLLDERHAVLELAKGKLTTDPKNHSGEGIFFTSRMFDQFVILSGGVFYSHDFGEKEDYILEASKVHQGTYVRMELNNHTARNQRAVFANYTSGEDFGFTKTVVPVKLTQYGDDNLVSRSQAKRLLARIDRFRVVVFDFTGVAAIGQSFADEVFRVFANHHPEIEITSINANVEVKQMISRAKSHDERSTNG